MKIIGNIKTNTINCDQVAWLLDIAERYISVDNYPAISRQRDMKKYGMLYEIMEILHLGFRDENARYNGTPIEVRQKRSLTDEQG